MGTAVILGGGISGLATSYYMSRASRKLFDKIILIESSDRVGGWMNSQRYDNGAVYEFGPRSVRTAGEAGKNTLQLVEEIGLESDLIPIGRSHPATRNRFIYVKGQLCKLPSGIGSLIKTIPPFSKPFALSLLQEPFKSSQLVGDDISIHDFFVDRFGQEIAEYAANPFCRGVFAGSSKHLSVKSCFPNVYNAVKTHGSIAKGLLLGERKKPPYKLDGRLVKRAVTEKWASWSTVNGLGGLSDTLHDKVKDHVQFHLNSPCQRIVHQDDKFTVHFNDKRQVVADHVFSTISAEDLAVLLDSKEDKLKLSLEIGPSVDVAIAHIEFDPKDLPSINGFGHLVPSTEPGCSNLGVIYDSLTYPQLDRKDRKVMKFTVMMGGWWFQEIFPSGASSKHIEDIAITSIQNQLNVKTGPICIKTKVLEKCIPQYLIGHSERLEQIEDYIYDNNLPLSLLGSSYHGVSVNDCIYNARKEVDRILGHHSQRSR